MTTTKVTVAGLAIVTLFVAASSDWGKPSAFEPRSPLTPPVPSQDLPPLASIVNAASTSATADFRAVIINATTDEEIAAPSRERLPVSAKSS